MRAAPSWLLAAVAVAAAIGIYGTPSRLNGPLLYDDKAAIMRNPVVIGAVPLSRVWVVVRAQRCAAMRAPLLTLGTCGARRALRRTFGASMIWSTRSRTSRGGR